jgi:hypothetical protein
VAVLRIYGETKVISVHIHNASLPAPTIYYLHKTSIPMWFNTLS